VKFFFFGFVSLKMMGKKEEKDKGKDGKETY